MKYDPVNSFADHPRLQPLRMDRDKALKALESGTIEDVSVSCKMPVDGIVNYALDSGIARDALAAFPDPRKNFTVPREVMLMAKIIRSLNNENSLVSAPHALNDAAVMAKLGYNYRVIEEGFNDMNTHERVTPYDGDTLRHFLMDSKPDRMMEWFNKKAAEVFRRESPGKTQTYIMDGVKLHVPEHLVDKYHGAGSVRNGEVWEHGYKAVWIYQLCDRKGLIVGMRLAPINVHDVVLGRELVKDFDFGDNATLIMDRGFWDFEWIRKLKEERGIDVCMPLKKNFFPALMAATHPGPEHPWEPHPRRKGEEVRKMSPEELVWEECPVFNSGSVVRYRNKRTGEVEHVTFVHTREGLGPEVLLETYGLRQEVEEMHRQTKLYQGLENLNSKKYPFTVFHILMGATAYNLFTLFLNSEGCENLRDYTLKLMRQKKDRYEKNPDMIIYAGDCFGIIKMREFLVTILGLPEKVRDRLKGIFGGLADDAYF